MNSEDYLGSIVTQLFLNELGRTPTVSELEQICIGLRTDPVIWVSQMLHSNELLARILSLSESAELVQHALYFVLKHSRQQHKTTRKFFMHIPKTAGTSINQFLNSHSTLTWHRADRKSPPSSIWPLTTGHCHWSEFEHEAKGFTILRDPMCRLVSAWLFINSPEQARERAFLGRPSEYISFEDCLQEPFAKPLTWFFFESAVDSSSLHTLGQLELRHISGALHRLEHIAVIEDPKSVQRAVKWASESDEPFQGFSNVTVKDEACSSITEREFQMLKDLTQLDYQLCNLLLANNRINYNYWENREKAILKYLERQSVSIR